MNRVIHVENRDLDPKICLFFFFCAKLTFERKDQQKITNIDITKLSAKTAGLALWSIDRVLLIESAAYHGVNHP